jgi:hypothetical protein
VAFFWTLYPPAGGAAGRSEEFGGREAAEAWLGEHWAELAESGIVEVGLNENEGEVYRMSLAEE